MKPNISILIIDDSKSICGFLTEILQGGERKIDRAEDGAKARALTAKNTYMDFSKIDAHSLQVLLAPCI